LLVLQEISTEHAVHQMGCLLLLLLLLLLLQGAD
jgi:hypothetical protein